MKRCVCNSSPRIETEEGPYGNEMYYAICQCGRNGPRRSSYQTAETAWNQYITIEKEKEAPAWSYSKGGQP